MTSNYIKSKILKHLSITEDSWGSTIAKVSKETGIGTLFVESAMKELVENKKLKRIEAVGYIDGKYGVYTDKRLTPTKSGPSEYEPWKTPLNPTVAS